MLAMEAQLRCSMLSIGSRDDLGMAVMPLLWQLTMLYMLLALLDPLEVVAQSPCSLVGSFPCHQNLCI